MNRKPVMLIILDGWGIREMEEGNAVKQGNTPNFDRWTRSQERAIVHTSGEYVGLVADQMGNSEVGHMNLGAGRVVYQDIAAIDDAIQTGALANKPALVEALRKAKAAGKKAHLIGLLGPGGVHSHQRHLHATLDMCKAEGVPAVVHVITDGRDTPPTSGIEFFHTLDTYMNEIKHGIVATVSGRYYAMDRDKRWERTRLAYEAIVNRRSDVHAETAAQAIEQFYASSDKGDEFVLPTVVGEDKSLKVESGDAVICYNFRADRMRQLVIALTVTNKEQFTPAYIENLELKNFDDYFHAEDYIPDLHLVTFTEYIEGLPVEIVFGKELIPNTLAEVISKAGRTQYHSAETEKYPHVTFFFNGRTETPFPGETRMIVPSPKVATYDLKPEMSAYELTAATLERLQTHEDDFLLINFANPDMVGHTGKLDAAIKAVEAVDECAGKLVEAVNAKGGVAIVTADHGNCERMIDLPTGEPHTYHTVGPVHFFVIDPTTYYELWTWGKLADVAPTVLDLMGLEQPSEMTGRSLIKATRAM